MKVSIESEHFKRVTSMISKILGTKGTGIPVLMSSADSVITMTAGKDGRFLTVKCAAEVEEPGDVITNNEWLASMRFRSKQVKFYTGKEGLSFAAGPLKGHFEIKTDSALIDENKPIKDIKKLTKLPTKLVRTALQTARIPSTDDSRCVKIVMRKKSFFLHTNDSYTGMYFKTGLEEDAECEVIIPFRVLESVLDFIETDTFKFGFDTGTMRFLSGSFDCYYPSNQSEVFNVNETIKDLIDREKSRATFTLKVKDTIDSLNDVINLGKCGVDDVTLVTTFDDKSNMVCNAKLPFGAVRHKVPIKDAKLTLKDKENIRISANILVGILQIVKGDTAEISILESSIIVKGDDVRYVFPLLTQG